MNQAGKTILRLRAENRELQALFDLQHKRMHEATLVWRKANPGNDMVLPDLGALLTWMLEQRANLLSLVGDYREGIDRNGTVAWSKKEAAAWYRAAAQALHPKYCYDLSHTWVPPNCRKCGKLTQPQGGL